MSKPEGYRKALRLMKTAEKFKLPVFTFVDTPGAYPGIDAEERSQSEAIGRNIYEMAQLEVPIITTIIGEGGSGGALAISVGEAEETVEDVYEPFLIQQGLLMRTPRGRVATPAAWAHIGMIAPTGAPLAAEPTSLFDP